MEKSARILADHPVNIRRIETRAETGQQPLALG